MEQKTEAKLISLNDLLDMIGYPKSVRSRYDILQKYFNRKKPKYTTIGPRTNRKILKSDAMQFIKELNKGDFNEEKWNSILDSLN